MKVFGIVLLLVGVSSFALASEAIAAPEISTASGAGALTLVFGALLVIRGRRRK